ncbi:MAG: molybdopterin-dependent oxidoreductase [Candidatus Lokiarchaeota archaeon]|nr:molybdopterin-dependent oxidoreductase [Candidatus Lokiarchaeota archaeon]
MTEQSGIIKVRTTCPMHCGIEACGWLVSVNKKTGRAIKIEPGEFMDPSERRICLRGLSQLDYTYHPDRIKTPLKRVGRRGEGKFESISWEEALDIIEKNFKEIAEKYGWRALGWVLGGVGAGSTKFGVYLRLASLTKSTRVSAWGYGDSGLPCGSRIIFGSQIPYGQLMHRLIDPPDPDLIVVWGCNPGEAAPLRWFRPIMDIKERSGTKMVTIDPRFTVTASKSDAYLGLRPGTDTALALSLLNIIFKNGYQKNDYIRKYTNGPYLVRLDTKKFLRGKDISDSKSKADRYVIIDHEKNEPKILRGSTKSAALTGIYTVNGIECKTALQLLMDLADELPPEKGSEITGVSAELITKLAHAIGKAKTTTFCINMGFTRTYHGHTSLRAMGTIAAITGNVRAEVGKGRNFPVLNWDPFLKAKPDERSYHRLGILNMYDAIEKGDPFPIKAVWFALTNFVNQCANSGKIVNTLFNNLDFIVTVDTFLTDTCKWSDLVLPTTSILEFSDFIPHPYPYVCIQQKVIEPLYESKSDVNIASAVAERLGFGEYFQGGEDGMIDLLLDTDHLSMDGITRESIIANGCFQLLNPIPESMETMPFPMRTPSKKIEIYSDFDYLIEAGEELPYYKAALDSPIKNIAEGFPLTFIQGHTRFRTHSMFGNVDSLLKMNPEPLLDMHPRDAEDRGLKNNDMVVMYNGLGNAILKLRVNEGIVPGTVNLSEGWWLKDFKDGGVNFVTHDIVNPVQDKIYEPNMSMNSAFVEVKKYKEEI